MSKPPQHELLAFLAVYAAEYQHEHELDGLHPIHFDLMKKYGARMDNFKRATIKPAAPIAGLAEQQPTDADWRAFGASDAACYLWPEDTEEHRNLRAAYVRGAADCGGAVSAGQSPAQTDKQR